MRTYLIAALSLLPSVAFAAPQPYAVICSGPCTITTGMDAHGKPAQTQERAGYVDNMIVLDPSTAHGFAAPAGRLLTPGAGLNIGQTASAAQIAAGISVMP